MKLAEEIAAALVETVGKSLPPCDLNSRMAKDELTRHVALAIREAYVTGIEDALRDVDSEIRATASKRASRSLALVRERLFVRMNAEFAKAEKEGANASR